MISKELKVIIDKFNKQGKMSFLEETTEEKISEFEKEHSVKLPAKYKEWLLFSDGGEFFLPAGIQLYGVEHLLVQRTRFVILTVITNIRWFVDFIAFVRQKIRTIINDGSSITFLAIKRTMA